MMQHHGIEDPWEKRLREGVFTQIDKLRADFTEAIRLNPVSIAHFNRGLAHTKKGEHDKAIADFTEVIRITAEYKDAFPATNESARQDSLAVLIRKSFHNRGKCYSAKGEHFEAVSDYTEAIRLDPTQAIFYVSRAQAYRALGDEVKAASDEQKAQERNQDRSLNDSTRLGNP
jgi:tetratricopeptide (TPR) repeat protein